MGLEGAAVTDCEGQNLAGCAAASHVGPFIVEDVDESGSVHNCGALENGQRLCGVLVDGQLSARAAVGVWEDRVSASGRSGQRQHESAGQGKVDGTGGDGEVRESGAVGRGHLGIDEQRQATSGLVDLESGDVAAGSGRGAQSFTATVGGRVTAGVSVAVGRIVFQRVEVVSRGVADEAEGIDALGKEGLLRGEDAVAADHELSNVGVLAGVGGGANRAARGVDAAVEDIKETAAGDQHGPDRVGAAGGDRQAVYVIQLAGVVIDVKAADDAVAAWLGRNRSCHVQIADRITLDARRNAEDDRS